RIGFFMLGLGILTGEIVACGSSTTPGATGTAGHSSTHSTTLTHTTTTSGSSSSSSSSSSSNFDNLGAACTADADCMGAPLKCTTAMANDPVFGGGPVNGYCSAPCMMDTDCGGSGLCLTDSTGTHGTCISSCMQGPALMHINDPISDMSKC